MSNTLIQIKRSSITPTPSNGSLNSGELAYSYNSDKLFIGNSSGTGVVEIGGRFYVDLTIAAFNAANNAAGNANSIGAAVNAYVQAVGAAGNAYALATATSIGTAGNNYTITVGTAGNNYTVAVGEAGNAYALSTATSIGTAGNNYTNAVGAAGNAYALDTATSIGTAGNNYTNAVGTAGNNYTNAVGADAKNYANSTFVKLVAPTQTITGNLAVTGSLTVSGNAFSIDTETLRVSDPLIYLAGNNYGADIVDIGFVANYNNGSANLHTGFFRDATTKEYYVFEGYNKEPDPNHIDIAGNNFTIAVLNATIKSSNIILNGTNTANWITAAFDKANNVATSANSYAGSIGDAANAYARLVGAAGNNYTNAVGAAGNAYALSTATTIGTAGNNYTNAVGAAGNNYTLLAYDKANSAVQTGFVTIVAGGNSLVADSNNDTLTINAANGVSIVGDAGSDTMTVGLSPTGVTIGTYGSPTAVGVFTVNEFGRITAASNSSIAIDTSAITSGILSVPRGGTGVNTFTENGILFGNTTGALKVTAAGTEGQVLQASSTGVPSFGMLDGGTF